jgi:prolyl oligopeptidase
VAGEGEGGIQRRTPAAFQSETDMPEIIYPTSHRVDAVEQHFGRRIEDPYRWLENDPHTDADVAAWIAAQNDVTRDHLAILPGRDRFRERFGALFNVEWTGLPAERGGRYFFTRQAADDSQAKLVVRDGGRDRVLIDPDAWSGDKSDALAEWAASDDGRRLVYGVQEGGSDWRTLRVVDVDTGERLDDELRWARFTQIVWDRDGSGFFYSGYPEPAEGAGDAALVGHAVWHHALGTAQSEDRCVYSDPARPQDLQIAARTDDGRYLAVYSIPGAGVNALSVIDLAAPSPVARALYPDHDAEWSLIGNEGAVLFLLTGKDAERRRIVTLDLALADPRPVEIVAEDEAVLNDAALVGGRLLARYLVDARSEVRRFRTDGSPDGIVTLPGIGSAGGFESRAEGDETFYIFTSFDTPTTVYRYDVKADVSEIWAQPKASVDPDAFRVEQRFYASRDGTRVPIFIIRRADVTGPTPTVLYGYGGFGIAMLPIYNPANMAWVDQGGAFAIAGIRGGGEYGRAWHVAGQFEKRQNAFDDFIAAGEFLKAEGVTTEDGLVVQGESNGGLLVGAVVNQRPDLFAAALPGVAPMDMLRYHLFTGGAFWIADFGSPEEEEPFRAILRYSPYHNIVEGRDYPAILAITADADSRVVPGHTFKYVAALQAADLGPKPRLVRVETRAGHGGGLPRDKTIALYSDMWAFAAHWAGLEPRDGR